MEPIANWLDLGVVGRSRSQLRTAEMSQLSPTGIDPSKTFGGQTSFLRTGPTAFRVHEGTNGTMLPDFNYSCDGGG